MTVSPAHEAEKTILAACLIDNKVIPDSLSPGDFYDHRHRTIYEAILALSEKGEPVDIVTLRKALGLSIERAGGIVYLASLIEGVPKLENLSAWVKIVREAAAIRNLTDEVSRVQRMLSDGANPSAILTILEGAASGMRERMHTGTGPKKLNEYLKPLLTQIEEESDGKPTGAVMTGFRDLDAMIGGFKPSELIVLAAGTGIGKSSFAANVAKNSGKSTLIVSLEMAGREIARRILLSDANIDTMKVRHGLDEHEWTALGSSFGALTDVPIWIDDTVRTPSGIRSVAMKLKDKHGLDFIVADYIQLLSHDKKTDNREQEVAQISGALKLIAMELNVPILALSQFNRAASQTARKDKRPILSDLRESGRIEQDANMVVFLHREPGKITSRTEVIIAKNRSGPTGLIMLDFNATATRYENIKETE